MITFPADWTQHFGVNLVTAYPSDTGARFRYHERLQPAPGFADIVRRATADDPDFRIHGVSETMRTVTCEGEYGAWVALEGRRQGKAARRYIGAVFMDDFAALLDAIAIRPDKFSEVELLSFKLLRSARFGMARRPRRFFYVPPVGWQGVPSGATANWYPSDFPNNRTTIVVPPAQLIEGSSDQAIESTFAQAGAGLAVDKSVRDELSSSSGVRGQCLRLEGERGGVRIHREVVIFVVAPFAYRMRFETAMAAELLDLREVFGGVAGSFRPLPSAEEIRLGRAFVSTSSVFDHWAS